jgi:hypothetical protein
LAENQCWPHSVHCLLQQVAKYWPHLAALPSQFAVKKIERMFKWCTTKIPSTAEEAMFTCICIYLLMCQWFLQAWWSKHHREWTRETYTILLQCSQAALP